MFEEIIKSEKENTVWIAYQQDKVFRKFKERENFLKMMTEFVVSMSAISFKIAIVKLIDKYPKIKNSTLSLNFLKRHIKIIK